MRPTVGWLLHLLTTIMVSHLQILVSRAYVRCGVKLPAPDTTSDVSPITILVGVGSLFVRGLVVPSMSRSDVTAGCQSSSTTVHDLILPWGLWMIRRTARSAFLC